MKFTVKKPVPPAGCWGYAVAFEGGDLVAVAAEWGNASAPVWALDNNGAWYQTGRQVAFYRHRPEAAIAEAVAEYVKMAGAPRLRRSRPVYIKS